MPLMWLVQEKRRIYSGTNLEDLKVSIAVGRLLLVIIAPYVENRLNLLKSCQKRKRDAFVVMEQERYSISADFEFAL